MPLRPVAFEHQDAGTEHDGHIRDIEDSRPQRANPNVHEVDHHSIRDPVEEIGGATGDEQSHSHERFPRPTPPQSDYDQGHSEESVADTEDRCSTRGGQSAPRPRKAPVFSAYSRRNVSARNDRRGTSESVVAAMCLVTRSQPIVAPIAISKTSRTPIRVMARRMFCKSIMSQNRACARRVASTVVRHHACRRTKCQGAGRGVIDNRTCAKHDDVYGGVVERDVSTNDAAGEDVDAGAGLAVATLLRMTDPGSAIMPTARLFGMASRSPFSAAVLLRPSPPGRPKSRQIRCALRARLHSSAAIERPHADTDFTHAAHRAVADRDIRVVRRVDPDACTHLTRAGDGKPVEIDALQE